MSRYGFRGLSNVFQLQNDKPPVCEREGIEGRGEEIKREVGREGTDLKKGGNEGKCTRENVQGKGWRG